MEAQTDVQTYIERGKQALAQGQAREAAIAYAHAAQIEPDNPYIHLGLAEANLALGAYGVVFMACKKVQELQPEGGAASTMAQALLNLLDRSYDRALQNLEAVIAEDPANAYAHAMRAYLLRITGQDYDAGLARSRAARLSYGGTFANVFPPVEQARTPGYNGNAAMPGVDGPPAGRQAPQIESDQVPNWNRSKYTAPGRSHPFLDEPAPTLRHQHPDRHQRGGLPGVGASSARHRALVCRAWVKLTPMYWSIWGGRWASWWRRGRSGASSPPCSCTSTCCISA